MISPFANKIFLRFRFVIFVLSIFFISCSKDVDLNTPEEEIDENEIFSGENLCDSFFPTDTFYLHLYETNANGYRTLFISFKSKDQSALEYYWNFPSSTAVDSIGSEVVFSFNPDSVDFNSTRAYTVNLVTVAFDGKRDTITKSIFIKKKPVQWLGKFTGYNLDNPTDTFSIFLIRTDQYGSGPSCCINYTIKNLPEGMDTFVKIPDIQTAFNFTLNNECDSTLFWEVPGYLLSGPLGYGNYSNGSIRIKYKYSDSIPDPENNVLRKEFVGVKVN